MPTKKHIIQISDLHVFGDPKKKLLGVNTRESFKAVVDLLKAESQIDAIILSGDLSQDGSYNSYRFIAEELDTLGCPVYYIAGNHDSADMDKGLAYGHLVNAKQISLNNWSMVLLNSQKQNAVEGYLDEIQFNVLSQTLNESNNEYIAVSFHHQPVLIGSSWIDQIGLKNANQFWALVDRYPQVKLVLFGHVHQVFEGRHKQVHCLSAPSTCIQFQPLQSNFALQKIPPGFRWIDLYPNGQYETGIKRLANYVGDFNPDAAGYD